MTPASPIAVARARPETAHGCHFCLIASAGNQERGLCGVFRERKALLAKGDDRTFYPGGCSPVGCLFGAFREHPITRWPLFRRSPPWACRQKADPGPSMAGGEEHIYSLSDMTGSTAECGDAG